MFVRRAFFAAGLLCTFSACVDPHQQRSADALARAEAAFDRYRRPDLILGALALRGDESVLDVGAGDGYLAVPIARTIQGRGRVVALDIDREALSELEARAKAAGIAARTIETRTVDPGDPALGDEHFDLILLSEVDHLLPDRARYLDRLRPHLARGGKLAVTNKRLHRDALISAANRAGLTVQRELDALPAHFLILFGAAP